MMQPTSINESEAEALQAYLDGEADADTRARIEAARQLDRGLDELIRRDQRMRERLRTAFDEVLYEPIPEALHRLVKTSSSPARDAAPYVRYVKGWRVPAYALAASLAIVTAIFAYRLDGSAPWVHKDGALIAHNGFAAVLERSMSASSVDGVRVGLTFLDHGGRWCRSFLGVEGGWQGLACREDGRWRIELLVQKPVIAGEVRQAGAEMAPEVLAAIDARIRGQALDVAQERAVIAAGWRQP